MLQSKFRLWFGYLLLGLGISFVSVNAYSQSLHRIKIEFSGDEFKSSKLNIHFYTGYDVMSVKKETGKTINKNFYSHLKYPVLEFFFHSSDNRTDIFRYFLKKDRTTIHFNYDSIADKLSVRKKNGAASFEDSGQREFDAFAQPEILVRDTYYKNFENKIAIGDSLVYTQFDKLNKAVLDKGLEYIVTGPPSLFNARFFMDNIVGKHFYSPEYLKTIYTQHIKTIFKNTFEEDYIENILDKNRLAISTMAPGRGLEFKDLSGKVHTLKDFTGRPLIITIWATWCVPCVDEIPKLKALYNKFQGKIAMVSFSTDNDEAKLKNYIAINKLPWINVYHRLDLCNLFGLDLGIPQVYLLDGNGQIVYSRTRMADYELSNLEKIIKEYVNER